jgi:hypothetical protein
MAKKSGARDSFATISFIVFICLGSIRPAWSAATGVLQLKCVAKLVGGSTSGGVYSSNTYNEYIGSIVGSSASGCERYVTSDCRPYIPCTLGCSGLPNGLGNGTVACQAPNPTSPDPLYPASPLCTPAACPSGFTDVGLGTEGVGIGSNPAISKFTYVFNCVRTCVK